MIGKFQNLEDVWKRLQQRIQEEVAGTDGQIRGPVLVTIANPVRSRARPPRFSYIVAGNLRFDSHTF